MRAAGGVHPRDGGAARRVDFPVRRQDDGRAGAATASRPRTRRCGPGAGYQLIDDTGYPGTLKPTQKTAANYDLQPPGRDATRPAGSWNTTRILVNGSHVEHWLNGVQIVAYELWSDAWTRLVAESKFKDHPRYARARKGRIGIQDHGDAASFRNIRIRELPPTPAGPPAR